MPDFAGYPQEARAFLVELAANNNKEWFTEHKADYKKFIEKPSLAFIEALGERLQTLSPGIDYDLKTNGAGSLMRIYRDTRFSKDKTPYKTWVGILWWEGPDKKTENPCYHFWLDADGAKILEGMHTFAKPMLAAYQQAVADDVRGAALVEALESAARVGNFRVGSENEYKRVPSEYDADHPRADLLKKKGLGLHSDVIGWDVITSPKLVDLAFEYAKALYPLHRWLVEVKQESVVGV